MSRYSDKLSAFLDGELPADEMLAIETALASDPDLQAELETLMAVDAGLEALFESQLDVPVPLEMAATVRDASEELGVAEVVKTRPSWVPALVAASIAAVILAGGGGYFLGSGQIGSVQTAQAAVPGWLVDIADYHRIYSAQERHLVEVPAEESEHIETWLTATLGTDVRIPDLTSQGLEFAGARLLVAAGKPVSQLMYKDASGDVVALCQISTTTPQDQQSIRTLASFDMVSWGNATSNFVIVGATGRADLKAIADAAALQS